MNKNNSTKKITSRDDNFSEWYLDIIREAGLAENSPVRGSMIIKPYGYSLWENIQKVLDNEFKKLGTENAYFPLLIPKSFLEKEAEHVDGFAKECAVVTHHRLEEKDGKLIPAGELKDPYIIRPTSETIIYDAYSKWIQSYRDLPVNINQWCNVMRWEMRPRLFLRTSEFLWQEGHTAHSSKEEANEKALEMIDVYQKFFAEYLAISVIKGKKTELEKFPGADYTSTIEAMMQDGKALQAGTSHMLGQNFAKSFDVSFLDENQEKQYVWQTSWGVSTRTIGALIMSHSDDKGLVLPPKIAPLQVIIVPIWKNDEERELTINEAHKTKSELEVDGIICKVDDRDERPGFKYFEWERKGVPLRIEIGPKDINNKSVVVVPRVFGKKEFVSNSDLLSFVGESLSAMQNDLLEQSKKNLKENTQEVSNYEEFKKNITAKNTFIYTHLCPDPSCEDNIKEETGASSRCIPFAEEGARLGNCVCCGKADSQRVLFAKAY